MKTTLTLLSIGLFMAHTQAQPVLTFAGQAPQPGTSYTMRYGPYVSPGNAGADQTWDLSGLETDSTLFIQLVQPGLTPNGGMFPTSTVAETGGEATMYFRSANDGMFFVGSEAEDLLIVNSDQGRYLPFPCTYQTNWTDAVAAQFTVDDIDVTRTGTITGVADGYGTLILPSGTVNNVLRIHWVQQTLDETQFFDMETTYDSYLFYAIGQPYPLVQLVSTTVNLFGDPFTEQYAQWVGGPTTGLPSVQSDPFGMEIFPVPASDRVSFELPLHFSGSPLITITDLSGKRVKDIGKLSVNGTKGQLDVSGFVPGVYCFMAIDEFGQCAVARFVVQ
jgi:hypothetical protein